jgi:hypothetical protein
MKFLEVWGLPNSRYNTAQRVMAFDWRIPLSAREIQWFARRIGLRISNMI